METFKFRYLVLQRKTVIWRMIYSYLELLDKPFLSQPDCHYFYYFCFYMSCMWIYFFVLHSANMTFFTYRKEAVEGPLELSEDVSVNIFKQKLDCVHLRALLGRDLLQRCNLPCTTYPGHGTLETAGTFCALYREIWILEWRHRADER